MLMIVMVYLNESEDLSKWQWCWRPMCIRGGCDTRSLSSKLKTLKRVKTHTQLWCKMINQYHSTWDKPKRSWSLSSRSCRGCWESLWTDYFHVGTTISSCSVPWSIACSSSVIEGIYQELCHHALLGSSSQVWMCWLIVDKHDISWW